MMPELLHEYWENEDGGEFTAVQKRADETRPQLKPNARLVFDVWAASWQEAMQLRNERLGYGDYRPAEGVPDHFYTADEASEQAAYLQRRSVS